MFSPFEHPLLILLLFPRFGCLENRPHSTGPVYISIADLPREHRFLQVNVCCPLITPGPHEPTYEQIVNGLELVAKDIVELKSGNQDSVIWCYFHTNTTI